MLKTINEIDFEKRNGLIPVVVQDINTKDVLMVGYINKYALSKTIDTGNAWFWSTSHNKLWMKGEESGNIQPVKKILIDCDSDALVYLVDSTNSICHTGNKTCFHNELQ
jgi:phosphoribosyl-AMP cyclohydrolase